MVIWQLVAVDFYFLRFVVVDLSAKAVNLCNSHFIYVELQSFLLLADCVERWTRIEFYLFFPGVDCQAWCMTIQAQLNVLNAFLIYIKKNETSVLMDCMVQKRFLIKQQKSGNCMCIPIVRSQFLASAVTLFYVAQLFIIYNAFSCPFGKNVAAA